MLKKIISISVACVICVTALFTIFVNASSFTDVPKDAYYAEAAERMADAGILSGFGDGRFYGEQELTRAQFAALACKLLGKVDEAVALAGKTTFADVPETHWSTGYVNYTVANKIINGDGDGNFRPDDSVKYEEALKVIVCLLLPGKTIEIDPADWSKNFIDEAKKLGITDNLIGKKGEFMVRSDIAVVADAAYYILNAEEETTTTTKKQGSGGNKPSTTTTAKEEEPEEIIVTTTTEAPAETTTTEVPAETTAETTGRKPIVPPPIIVTGTTELPPPPGDNEGEEF